MTKIFITLFLVVFMASNLYASQSTITESDGYACMGEDKSMEETEHTAMADAKDSLIYQLYRWRMGEKATLTPRRVGHK